MEKAKQWFKPLPQNMATEVFPTTASRVALGRKLFSDPRISLDGTVSCVSTGGRRINSAPASERRADRGERLKALTRCRFRALPNDYLVERRVQPQIEELKQEALSRATSHRATIRRLPMVRIEKDYVFESPSGKKSHRPSQSVPLRRYT